MIKRRSLNILLVACCSALVGCGINDKAATAEYDSDFVLVKYNNPGAVSDLGVGLWAWPLPMDFDGDNDMDLVVSCPDKPFNGLYFFENSAGDTIPVFEPPVRLGDAIKNIQVSYVGNEPRVLIPGAELLNFTDSLDRHSVAIFPPDSILKDFAKAPRFNQWKLVDHDGDDDLDLIVGIDDWSDYGWDNAYDKNGNWTNGPLHGYLYLIENVSGRYVNRGRLHADGTVIDVYGAPSPNFADFDGDGDLDIICGEFLDKLTWFENVGSRHKPKYAKGKFLQNSSRMIRMDLQMITPAAVDWNSDGYADLVVGDEDGRVALVENTGEVTDGMPVFKEPVYFKQKADNLKFGALATPVSVDWDNDGDEDIICGNSAGYIAFIENLGMHGNMPRWALPELLLSEGNVIRVQAGENGSIQGPAEAKWGYTTLSVADWDGDELNDLIVNSIWGKVVWFRNVGTKSTPRLAAEQPLSVSWGTGEVPRPAGTWWNPQANTLATQWRTTPVAIDWNRDGLMDLVMLDHEGYLSFFERYAEEDNLKLRPGKRLFYGVDDSGFDARHVPTDTVPGVLRLNTGQFGKSGRRKLCLADWDGNGTLDFLVNSTSVTVLNNIGESEGMVHLKTGAPLGKRILAGHTTSPTTVDWNRDGKPDLLVGAEDGHFYYLVNK